LTLAFENASDIKHEFVEGLVFAMTGVHTRHNRIAGNIYTRLSAASGDGPCRAYIADVKLRVAEDRIYYPDVMSLCTEPNEDELVIDDPCVVVEVTSASTQRIDRTEKRDAYLKMPSLKVYLVVEQRRRQVDLWRRDAEGAWQHAVLIEQGMIELPCPTLALSLDDIYRGVSLPEPKRRRVREPEPSYGEPG
jgi:Uma2 family endonuclease